MIKPTVRALLVATVLAASVTGLPSIAVAAETNSAAAAKPLDAANKAIKANKWDDAIAELQKVNALSNKTAYDTYVMNQLLSFAYAKKNNYAEASKAMEAQLASSYATPAQKVQLNKQLLGVYFNQKNYTKAADLANQLVSSGAADATTYNVLAQAYEKQGKLPEAVKLVKARVDASAKPSENELLLLLDYQRRLKDTAGETATFEKLVGFYPKAEYWENIIPSLLRAPGNSDEVTLGVYRLMSSTNTLKKKEDFTEMAQLALEQHAPNEAVEVLQKGLTTNVFTEQRDKDRANRLIESAKGQIATAQAGLTKAETDAKAGAAGELALGRMYFGLGEYDKAADALQRGLTKGAGAEAANAQILLGIALLRGKKKDDAVKSFRGVKSADANVQRLGALWALYARG